MSCQKLDARICRNSAENSGKFRHRWSRKRSRNRLGGAGFWGGIPGILAIAGIAIPATCILALPCSCTVLHGHNCHNRPFTPVYKYLYLLVCTAIFVFTHCPPFLVNQVAHLSIYLIDRPSSLLCIDACRQTAPNVGCLPLEGAAPHSGCVYQHAPLRVIRRFVCRIWLVYSYINITYYIEARVPMLLPNHL
jgi:hypothetical protein